MTRIALVRLSSLGDVVHAMPVAMALARRSPRPHVTWLVQRREAALLEGHPGVDDVVVVDTRAWRRPGGLRAAVAIGRGLVGFRRRLRRAHVDVALDLQGLVKSGLFTALTGAPLRIGFAARHCREPLSAVFTNRRIVPPVAAGHIVDRNLALLSPLGADGAPVEFGLAAPDVPEVTAFLDAAGVKQHDRLVVLAVGTARPEKQWPMERFAALATRLVDEASVAVLVLWGPGERPRAEAIVAGVGRARALLAPPTDVRGLVGLVSRASAVIAGDTGPLHVAAALGVPCVGLYGPTSPRRNGPYGSGHRVVESANGTLGAITEGAVFAAVTDLLG